MLFDLEGKGRKTTVKIIYSGLAILLGGGLVLFGIGSGLGGGGIVDAVVGQGQSTNDVYEKEIDRAKKQIASNPKNAAAWAALTKAQVQRASTNGLDTETGQFTEEGRVEITAAAVSWQRYLDLDPKKIDPGTAQLMVQVYGPSGLNQPDKAAIALKEVIASGKNSAGLYAQLALLSYQTGNKSEAKLAEERALELTPKKQRKGVAAQIKGQKTQIDALLKQQQIEQQQQQQAPQGLGG